MGTGCVEQEAIGKRIEHDLVRVRLRHIAPYHQTETTNVLDAGNGTKAVAQVGTYRIDALEGAGHAPVGKPEAIPLAMETISGTIPKFWKPKGLPVR